MHPTKGTLESRQKERQIALRKNAAYKKVQQSCNLIKRKLAERRAGKYLQQMQNRGLFQAMIVSSPN